MEGIKWEHGQGLRSKQEKLTTASTEMKTNLNEAQTKRPVAITVIDMEGEKEKPRRSEFFFFFFL